uniref:Uncharacterized protein n=1 Tax=Onchocerca volvulus TaxID=6282 RepID=A0A8R1TWI6_ONCVO
MKNSILRDELNVTSTFVLIELTGWSIFNDDTPSSTEEYNPENCPNFQFENLEFSMFKQLYKRDSNDSFCFVANVNLVMAEIRGWFAHWAGLNFLANVTESNML